MKSNWKYWKIYNWKEEKDSFNMKVINLVVDDNKLNLKVATRLLNI